MDLFEHLRELRRRIIYSFIAVLAGAVASWSFSQELFAFLSQPYYDAFPGRDLIGTGLAEAFLLKLKVAVFAGIMVVSPFLFLQVWLFVAPGLYDNERRLAAPFLISTTGLFLVGVWFCYRWVLPVTFQFFYNEYLSIAVTPTVRISEHLSMMMQALIGFGAVFQMPVLAFFFGRLGLITHHTLIRGARYAIVLIFVVSAVLTPPDVMTQLMMAGPLLLLYGFSILILRFTARPELSADEPEERSDVPARP